MYTYIKLSTIHKTTCSKIATLKQKLAAQNKQMRLLLSSDAKPRLRWTSELHQQFIDAIEKLGGAEKATPKSLMKVMGIHGLTLYHLKSHLQKYRMGKSQQSRTCHRNKQQECGEKTRLHFTSKTTHDGAKERINDLQMAEALRMQIEVQRKLHEQIEIQKHLQLRVESQGKYLTTVLRKAEEAISEYGSCSIEAENARAQLAEMVSMVDSTCPSPESTQKEGSSTLNHGSLESSSLTSSSEGSWRKEERCENEGERNFLSLSLMEMLPAKSVDDGSHAEEAKRLPLTDTFDLNNEFDSKLIDLNRKGDDE